MNFSQEDLSQSSIPPSTIVTIDVSETYVRSAYDGTTTEWATAVSYLQPNISDHNSLQVGDVAVHALQKNPLSGVRLVPTLLDIPFVLLNNHPHSVDELLTRLLAPSLPLKVADKDPDIVLAHPSSWGTTRIKIVHAAASKIGSTCTVLPRSLALAHSLGIPEGRAFVVIEAQASSVDISLLMHRLGVWSLRESRRIFAQPGDPIHTIVAHVSHELSIMHHDHLGLRAYPKSYDGIIIDAPARLKDSLVNKIREVDSSFEKISIAPRFAVLQGLSSFVSLRESTSNPSRSELDSVIEKESAYRGHLHKEFLSGHLSTSTATTPPQKPVATPHPSTVPSFTAPVNAPFAGPASHDQVSPSPTHDAAPSSLAGFSSMNGSHDSVYSHTISPNDSSSLFAGVPSFQAEPERDTGSVESSFVHEGSSSPTWLVVGLAALLVCAVAVAIVWFARDYSHDAQDSRSHNSPTNSYARIITPTSPTLTPNTSNSLGQSGGNILITVADPEFQNSVLLSFQLADGWSQIPVSACPPPSSESAPGKSFRSAMLLFHSTDDPCAEIGVSYEGIDSEATLQSIGENIEEEIHRDPRFFTDLQFGVSFGQNTFDSYRQPSRDASWFLFVTSHRGAKLLVSIGCRNNARGEQCEIPLTTLSVAE